MNSTELYLVKMENNLVQSLPKLAQVPDSNY